MAWICSRCAGSNVTALDSRPSLDDRFAVGWCDRCTPVPTFDPKHPDKTRNRSTIALVQDNDKSRDAINDRDRRTAERKLVEKSLAGGVMSDADRERAVGIRRRWADEAEARRSA